MRRLNARSRSGFREGRFCARCSRNARLSGATRAEARGRDQHSIASRESHESPGRVPSFSHCRRDDFSSNQHCSRNKEPCSTSSPIPWFSARAVIRPRVSQQSNRARRRLQPPSGGILEFSYFVLLFLRPALSAAGVVLFCRKSGAARSCRVSVSNCCRSNLIHAKTVVGRRKSFHSNQDDNVLERQVKRGPEE